MAELRQEIVHAENVVQAWELLLSVEKHDVKEYDTEEVYGKTTLGHCLLTNEVYDEESKRSVEEFFDSDKTSSLTEGRTDYIDCGAEEYFIDEVIEVDPVPSSSVKYKDVYVLKYKDGFGNPQEKEYDKADFKKAEIAELFVTGCYDIALYKYKKAVTDNKICSYSRKVTQIDKKPSSGKYKEIHQFIFLTVVE